MALTSKISIGARVVLGGMFVFSGLNGFLHFAPLPPMPAKAGEFIGAMLATGYLFPLVKALEIAAGSLLLAGRFVPLALTVLAPIVVNVVAFHALLAPAGVAIPLVLLAAEIYLAWTHRASFAPMLQAKTSAAAAESSPPARLATI